MSEHSGFRKTGNLTFYDGWSPDYVYFKSLLSYADTISDDHHGGWDPDEAMKIANKAVQDA